MRMALDVVMPERLFKPEIAVGAQRPANLDGFLQGIGPVGIDTKRDIITGPLPQALDPAVGY